jgi:Ni/Fe-hydrogenase 1 B-type cytochrome subunit
MANAPLLPDSLGSQAVTDLPSATSDSDYSGPLRVWHWGSALLIAGQLLTILFLKVILNLRTAVPQFQQALSKDGVTLSQQQGRAITHIISERIWEWHIYIGLALAGFWLFRLAVELRGPAPRRYSTRLLGVARRYKLALPAEHGDIRHSLFAKATYALFYIFLTVIVVTGLALTWADDIPFLHSIEHTMKEIHNVTMYLIIAFTIIHIIGVVRAELTKDHGLISRMIGGK